MDGRETALFSARGRDSSSDGRVLSQEYSFLNIECGDGVVTVSVHMLG